MYGSIHDLKKIGLSNGEIRVYDALLQIGESTRTKLARKSGISPSKIYDVTSRLLEKGIISCVKKNGVLHFSPANPHRLLDFLTQKEDEVKDERALITTMLPMLLGKFEETREELDVEVFYGWEGMKTVYGDIAARLGKKDINYVFGASKGEDPRQGDIFFAKYYKLIEKKGYSLRIIFNENINTNRIRTAYFENNPRHKIRYLYQDTFTEINLYKDTVLFIMLLKKPIIIRIRSIAAADSFKKFFDTMWEQAKPASFSK